MNIESNLGEFSGDDSNKFFITDSSIAIFVGIVNHLVNFSRGESFPNGITNSFKVFGAKGIGSLRVKDFIKLLKRLLRRSFVLTEDGKESGEVKFLSISVGLDDGDNVGSLAFHVEGSDGVNNFLHGDLSTVVIVEQIEHFFKF